MNDPADRLARKLPPDGVRRVLSRLDSMSARGEQGEVCVVVIGEDGTLRILVREEFGWREQIREAKRA